MAGQQTSLLTVRFAPEVRPIYVTCPSDEIEEALVTCFGAELCDGRARFEKGYEEPAVAQDHAKCEEVTVTGGLGRYSLLDHVDVPLETALGLLDACFDAAIRSSARPQLATVHSFGLVTADGGGVAIIGTSTAGKTTLGLSCACAGMHPLGDEFGFLDLNTAQYSHASYPLCVREETWGVTGIEKPERLWHLKTPLGNECDMLSMSQLPGAVAPALPLNDEGSVPLKYIVCPLRETQREGVIIEGLSVVQWPAAVLPSIDAPEPRDRLFASLVSLASSRGIHVVGVRYSDAKEAASAIAVWTARGDF